MENNPGNDGLPSRLSAAEKLQQLKTQQAKLEKRAMPAHFKLKVSVSLQTQVYYRVTWLILGNAIF